MINKSNIYQKSSKLIRKVPSVASVYIPSISVSPNSTLCTLIHSFRRSMFSTISSDPSHQAPCHSTLPHGFLSLSNLILSFITSSSFIYSSNQIKSEIEYAWPDRIPAGTPLIVISCSVPPKAEQPIIPFSSFCSVRSCQS